MRRLRGFEAVHFLKDYLGKGFLAQDRMEKSENSAEMVH